MLGVITLPVIWRGVAFRFGSYDMRGGRRVAIHEFPTRDEPFTEDLGRRIRQYRLRGHVIGPMWEASRDALISACEDSSAIGTLIHPYLGPLRVRCLDFQVSEDKDAGQIANFEFQFVEAGEEPGPSSFLSTAMSVLRQVESVIATINTVFTVATALVGVPAALVSAFAGWCSGLIGSLSALPLASDYDLASLLPGIAATPTDSAATAAAVTDAIGEYAAAIGDGTIPTGRDPSGGLAAIASSWGDDVLAAGGTGQQLANAQAIVDLVRGAATCGVATVYADADRTSADAAAAASAQLASLIDARATAAAATGQDDLYSAWQALASVTSQDLAVRAQQLPHLVGYARTSPPPALSLAYRLYQDANRSPELVALNDAPHPLFLPMRGKALAV